MSQIKGKCLIVEDDPPWQQMLRKIPAQAKCEIHVATSLAAAHGLIERHFFHVAIVDLSLIPSDASDRSGLDILSWLRDLKEGTQGILVTGHGTLEVGFDVGTRFAGTGVMSKAEFSEAGFAKLFESAMYAAKEEQQKLLRRFPSPEVELLRGDKLAEVWEFHVIDALHEEIELVHTVLHLLFSPLAPLLEPKQGSPSSIDVQNGIVRGRLWSRGIGRTVTLTFGVKAGIQPLMAALPASEIVSHCERANMAGFAVIDSDGRFEDFESPFETLRDTGNLKNTKRREVGFLQ